MRTYSQIDFPVIERIQVDVVDFAAFRSDKYYSVNTESVAVANITRTRIALVPSPIDLAPENRASYNVRKERKKD